MKGKKNWRHPFSTSMILGGRVLFKMCPQQFYMCPLTPLRIGLGALLVAVVSQLFPNTCIPLYETRYMAVYMLSVYYYPHDPWDEGYICLLLIDHKNPQNAGKYTIHGSYGAVFGLASNDPDFPCLCGET